MSRFLSIYSILGFIAAIVIGGCSKTSKDGADAAKPAGDAAKSETKGTPAGGAADTKAAQPVTVAGKESPAPAPAPAPAAATAEKKDAAAAEAAKAPGAPSPALLDPSLAKEQAPAKFKIKFATTKGDFTVDVTREWAPNGADRLYNLVKIGYFTDIALFRVIRTPRPFMAQFGIHGNPSVSAKWREAKIPDDPVKQSNSPGRLTFATAGPNTRTTQLFINFGDNSGLDRQGFSPVGEVTQGMEVVNALNGEYGEGAPAGRGPNQTLIQMQGNKYLRQAFPNLDYVKTATIVE